MDPVHTSKINMYSFHLAAITGNGNLSYTRAFKFFLCVRYVYYPEKRCSFTGQYVMIHRWSLSRALARESRVAPARINHILHRQLPTVGETVAYASGYCVFKRRNATHLLKVGFDH